MASPLRSSMSFGASEDLGGGSVPKGKAFYPQNHGIPILDGIPRYYFFSFFFWWWWWGVAEGDDCPCQPPQSILATDLSHRLVWYSYRSCGIVG
ncbi:hypothetical protein CRG98_026022 [Punica granatum]|uniref:Uncharacterized protein n=1 Tax=Punica granatum TaxID=22663 RepID=A0A2I0JBD3_PUNGR|nr:hypothetical protein CRG98_026022 [Punica granatum]